MPLRTAQASSHTQRAAADYSLRVPWTLILWRCSCRIINVSCCQCTTNLVVDLLGNVSMALLKAHCNARPRPGQCRHASCLGQDGGPNLQDIGQSTAQFRTAKHSSRRAPRMGCIHGIVSGALLLQDVLCPQCYPEPSVKWATAVPLLSCPAAQHCRQLFPKHDEGYPVPSRSHECPKKVD